MAWHALGAAAAVVLVGAGVIALGKGSVPPASEVEEMAPVARRCVNCGWIESKRQILQSVADPHALQTYEYTLRMANGSSSVFQETLPASWRLGERVRVIDGTGPRD